MYRLVFLSFFLFKIVSTIAQNKAEMGVFGGTSMLLSDVNSNQFFLNPSYSAGLIYKYNHSTRYVYRINANYSNISANDANSFDDYQNLRNINYSANVIDLSLLFEFNFLPFKFAERKKSFSPYANAGLGFYSSPNKVFALMLPLGAGVKYTLNNRWAAGAEWNIVKTFTDNFEGVENVGTKVVRPALNNKDWYYKIGFTITYKVFDDPGDCPELYK